MYRYNDYADGIHGLIKDILAGAKLAQADLARSTNQSPQSLNEKLRNNTMRVREFAEIADVLGYEIVLLKK